MKAGFYKGIIFILLAGAILWLLSHFLDGEKKPLTLIATTTTETSGFLDYIIPLAEKDTGIKIRIISFGTGKVLRSAQDGNADLILVHDPLSEENFIQQGHGLKRYPVMMNNFILVGPKHDPAGIGQYSTIEEIFGKLHQDKTAFISRGDDSGTHKAEQRIWQSLGLEPAFFSSQWYKKSGAGMGRSLNIAVESGAYILCDQASWLTFHNKGDLIILHQDDEKLKNIYSLIPVNPLKHPHLQAEKAQKVIDWFLSAQARNHIRAFKHQGKTLYIPIS